MKHDTQTQDGMPEASGMKSEYMQQLRARCLAEGMRIAQTLERERVGKLLGGMLLALAVFESADDEVSPPMYTSDMAGFVRALLAEAELGACCHSEESGKEDDHE